MIASLDTFMAYSTNRMTNSAQLLADEAEIVPSCWQNSTVKCLVSNVKLTCQGRQKMEQRMQAESTNLLKLESWYPS
jgi:hypothetical protein